MRPSKVMYVEPHVIDIAKWIDEGKTYQAMADEIGDVEGCKISRELVYKYAQRKGLVKRRVKPRSIFDRQAVEDEHTLGLRVRGCKNCLYDGTCRGFDHCHFTVEDLREYHKLNGTTGGY